jgi:mono/diheme cytochrome c family protein
MNTCFTPRILTSIAGGLLLAGTAFADTNSKKVNQLTPEAAFAKTVQPFLAGNCVGCHNAKVKTANLDLTQFNSVQSVRANLKVWKKVAWKLQEGEMPPAKLPRPKPAAQKATLKWIKAELASADTSK